MFPVFAFFLMFMSCVMTEDSDAPFSNLKKTALIYVYTHYKAITFGRFGLLWTT